MSSLYCTLTKDDVRVRREDRRTEFIWPEYMKPMSVRVWFPCATPGCKGETNFEDVPCPLCCPECKRLDREAVYNTLPHKMDEAAKKITLHMRTFHQRISKSHIGNGTFNGKFAFTLTKAPTDDLTEEDMIKAVRKLMAQKSCPVKEYAWYLEYGDMENNTHPHIHGLYETESGGRIEAKHFKRAWKIWDEKQRQGVGFRGGYHRPVRDNEGYSDYIKKYGGEHDTNLNF